MNKKRGTIYEVSYWLTVIALLCIIPIIAITGAVRHCQYREIRRAFLLQTDYGKFEAETMIPITAAFFDNYKGDGLVDFIGIAGKNISFEEMGVYITTKMSDAEITYYNGRHRSSSISQYDGRSYLTVSGKDYPTIYVSRELKDKNASSYDDVIEYFYKIYSRQNDGSFKLVEQGEEMP